MFPTAAAFLFIFYFLLFTVYFLEVTSAKDNYATTFMYKFQAFSPCLFTEKG